MTRLTTLLDGNHAVLWSWAGFRFDPFFLNIILFTVMFRQNGHVQSILTKSQVFMRFSSLRCIFLRRQCEVKRTFWCPISGVYVKPNATMIRVLGGTDSTVPKKRLEKRSPNQLAIAFLLRRGARKRRPWVGPCRKCPVTAIILVSVHFPLHIFFVKGKAMCFHSGKDMYSSFGPTAVYSVQIPWSRLSELLSCCGEK